MRHAAGPQGEDVVTMQLSEADINAYLAGSKKLKASLEAKGVHAVSVELAPPNVITFHAAATLKGLSGNGLVAATLTPDPKTSVHLDITDARFGRLPPPIVKAAAGQIITRLLVSPRRHPVPVRPQGGSQRDRSDPDRRGKQQERGAVMPPQTPFNPATSSPRLFSSTTFRRSCKEPGSGGGLVPSKIGLPPSSLPSGPML